MAKRSQEDIWSFVHRYYEREMEDRIPIDHATTVVVVVGAMQEYMALHCSEDDSDTCLHGRDHSRRGRRA